METSFIFIAGGLFVLGIMIYVLFMVFLPEWVGITGKKALEAEQSHVGDNRIEDGHTTSTAEIQSPANDVLNRMENVRSQNPSRSGSATPPKAKE